MATVMDLPVRMSWFDRLILRFTRRRWNRVAATVLCRAYEMGTINSQQLHIIAREFDPTQAGTVGRL